jgi:ubiquinone/menaquinone biosynthesis C-methylase UbiE
MNTRNQQIQKQYDLNGLYEEILNRLKQQGKSPGNISRSDIAGVDEFHVRGAEVTKELVAEFDFHNLNVLDVGCGIGGPARMLADEFNCTVSGIDMSPEYINTANMLTDLVGLSGSIDFVQGDALDLPYTNESFDAVWTQHVQMNIEDKTEFYTEIHRVLKPGGSLIYYDIFQKNEGDITHPVPWADTADVSFLHTIANMQNILNELGFENKSSKNQTVDGIFFFEKLFEKIQKDGPPKLGLNVLMGASTKEKLGNVMKALKGEQIELESGIYTKPTN